MLAGLAFAVACTVQATEDIHRVELAAAADTMAESFSRVLSVRELSDDRLLISVPREQRIVVADFADAVVRAIGRSGNGPGEYRNPGFLFAIGADSTIQSDVLARRWLLMSGPEFVTTVAPDDPALVVTGALIDGADRLGRVLVHRFADPPDGVSTTSDADSAAVVLVARSTGAQDTVAMIAQRRQRFEVARNSAGETVRSLHVPAGPFTTEEGAALFPDGTVAVARTDPFRVDWFYADGRTVHGAPLPVPPVPANARERAAFMRRNADVYERAVPPGTPRITPPSRRDFPARIPPFTEGARALIPASDGSLLVRRTPTSTLTGNHYLVIERDGNLRGQINLDSTARVLGFGDGTIYVAIRDSMDLERIVRHAWP